MKTILNDLGDIAPSYPVENLEDPDKILFLDIETTGFTAKSSNLYMIGCAYHENDEWHTIQWLAENYDEEVMVLNAFLEYCLNYNFISFQRKPFRSSLHYPEMRNVRHPLPV